jgi:hypothetical protein
LCSWCLRVCPYPTEVAGLRWRDVISDVCAVFIPYEIKWVGISDLWRVGVQFVGSLACCLIPYGSFWRLNVSVERLCHTDEVSASTIDDVERAVDHLVCL